jgi:hypothetical protein
VAEMLRVKSPRPFDLLHWAAVMIFHLHISYVRLLKSLQHKWSAIGHKLPRRAQNEKMKLRHALVCATTCIHISYSSVFDVAEKWAALRRAEKTSKNIHANKECNHHRRAPSIINSAPVIDEKEKSVKSFLEQHCTCGIYCSRLGLVGSKPMLFAQCHCS